MLMRITRKGNCIRRLIATKFNSQISRIQSDSHRKWCTVGRFTPKVGLSNSRITSHLGRQLALNTKNQAIYQNQISGPHTLQKQAWIYTSAAAVGITLKNVFKRPEHTSPRHPQIKSLSPRKPLYHHLPFFYFFFIYFSRISRPFTRKCFGFSLTWTGLR